MNIAPNPQRLTILIMSGTYLPGTKNGGPVRSLSNMVEWLGDDFNFLILTADRDHGDLKPYPNIQTNDWYAVGKACVRYLAPQELKVLSVGRIIREVKHELLFIDSILGNLSILTLLARRFGLLSTQPIVITPRGHISSGALSIKSRKKRIFLEVGKVAGLFRNLNWLASSEEEKADLLHEFGNNILVEVIPNLTSVAPSKVDIGSRNKIPGQANFVFLSRITPKKNLAYLLTQLKYIEGSVQLDIYGPIEDDLYWEKCQTLIRQLPSNIKVGYKGIVPFDRVIEVLSGYHLFTLPTLSENFGHVIVEALSSGCPVLISDQTPWNTINDAGAGWAVPLGQDATFQQKLQFMVDLNFEQFTLASENAIRVAEPVVKQQTHLLKIKNFLLNVAS